MVPVSQRFSIPPAAAGHRQVSVACVRRSAPGLGAVRAVKIFLAPPMNTCTMVTMIHTTDIDDDWISAHADCVCCGHTVCRDCANCVCDGAERPGVEVARLDWACAGTCEWEFRRSVAEAELAATAVARND